MTYGLIILCDPTKMFWILIFVITRNARIVRIGIYNIYYIYGYAIMLLQYALKALPIPNIYYNNAASHTSRNINQYKPFLILRSCAAVNYNPDVWVLRTRRFGTCGSHIFWSRRYFAARLYYLLLYWHYTAVVMKVNCIYIILFNRQRGRR